MLTWRQFHQAQVFTSFKSRIARGAAMRIMEQIPVTTVIWNVIAVEKATSRLLFTKDDDIH